MRETKFRGMLRSGEWVYGGYVKIKGGAYCILSGECDSYDIDGGVKNILKFNAVKYKTVGEYTGLKDKNGKEQYESDIKDFGMYSNKKYGRCLHVIYWDKESAGFYTRELGFQKLAGFPLGEDGKVIGNIHENQELLEGGK